MLRLAVSCSLLSVRKERRFTMQRSNTSTRRDLPQTHLTDSAWAIRLRRGWAWLRLVRAGDPVRQVLNRAFVHRAVRMIVCMIPDDTAGRYTTPFCF